MAEPVTVGDRLAEIALGAAAGQVIVADSTTVLLYKLIRAAVAARPGRDELVIDRANFPTDRFIVDGVAAERGLTVRYLTPPHAAGVRPDDVAAAIGERTALVVLSHVAYRSGFLADMAAITSAAHEAGALILWDLCHSAGVLPIELDACDVDLAAGCTYKYLNGGPGSPAFCYVATRLQEELRQPIWGWMGAGDPFAMGPEYRAGQGDTQVHLGHPAGAGDAAAEGHARADRRGGPRGRPAQVGRAHRARDRAGRRACSRRSAPCSPARGTPPSAVRTSPSTIPGSPR